MKRSPRPLNLSTPTLKTFKEKIQRRKLKERKNKQERKKGWLVRAESQKTPGFRPGHNGFQPENAIFRIFSDFGISGQTWISQILGSGPNFRIQLADSELGPGIGKINIYNIKCTIRRMISTIRRFDKDSTIRAQESKIPPSHCISTIRRPPRFRTAPKF